MAGDTKPCVDVATVPPVGLCNGSRQTILGTGREDQMDMIRHEAIGPYLDTVSDAVLGEQVSVECLIVLLNEDPLTTVTPLRDMVGSTGNGDSGKTSH